jgi:hypothetical protein
MKALKLIALGILLSLGYSANSQIIVDATIAMEPIWSIIPIEGPRYVYYPDQEMYYDNQTYMYVYLNGSSWGRSAYIPQAFINVNFGAARRFKIDDYRGRTPYVNIEDHRRLYGGRDGNGPHDRAIGGGNEHGEHGRDNGVHGNENVNHGNVNHGNENVNRGHENENKGGENEHKGGGEHGGKK